jgi:hypothetical protein
MMRKQQWLPAVLLMLIAIPLLVMGQAIRVRLEGNQLRATFPDFHFLIGEAQRQLHNGASVNYVLRARLSLDRNGSPLTEMSYRFVFSYDLWEEKYSVTRLDPQPRSISHLSASAAETWCLDSISLPVDALSPDRAFWLSVDYEMLQTAPNQSAENDQFTLTGLIDIFSRRNQKKELTGKRESGPFRIADLRRNAPSR